ncbi:hypothetical protein POSPLADRAFT_1059406 [Postia placenta MAD-698-R-SB12]|uniref:Uncharacterized protein n=1 Tax=Postia placenta MAD-698-R-SB12 TaxID=670580 RepID=A0A1X6MS20_9APHY|nr:hypothetical protein POSPLADRAFT_1059406 [Postia placenta MAD-698-R-SB12]OSX59194.1 hypothetical protein POSPLADRAFT_1059406 [Postia placenta MAD-698-R-SB12]
MTALPSFVELMATLGLDKPAGPAALPRQSGPACSGVRVLHSRSSSASSTASFSTLSSNASPPYPSISIDGLQAASSPPRETSTERDMELERRHTRVARYSPYYPTISHMRKRSVPIIKEEADGRPNRALSTSPYLLPATCAMSRRSASIAPRSSSRRPQKLTLSETDLTANMPISSFVRRKTPQASPTSPTFPNRRRKRSSSPTLPVCIPTVPMIFPPIQAFRYASSDSEDEEMHDVSDTPVDTSQLPRLPIVDAEPQTSRPATDSGVRISVFSRPDELNSYAQQIAPLPVA